MDTKKLVAPRLRRTPSPSSLRRGSLYNMAWDSADECDSEPRVAMSLSLCDQRANRRINPTSVARVSCRPCS